MKSLSLLPLIFLATFAVLQTVFYRPQAGSRSAPGDKTAIFQAAVEIGTMLEINAAPERLDLNDVHARRAVSGVKLTANCDAHSVYDFGHLHFGVATACRGRVTAEDIVNTRSLEEVAEGERSTWN